MFYCDSCREKNNWPKSIVKSVGKCEMCDKGAVCHDIPCRLLPKPEPK